MYYRETENEKATNFVVTNFSASQHELVDKFMRFLNVFNRIAQFTAARNPFLFMYVNRPSSCICIIRKSSGSSNRKMTQKPATDQTVQSHDRTGLVAHWYQAITGNFPHHLRLSLPRVTPVRNSIFPTMTAAVVTTALLLLSTKRLLKIVKLPKTSARSLHPH